MKALLAFLERPRTRAEIAAHLESLSGAPLERPEVLDEALALLDDAGAILHASAERAPPPSRGRLLLGISGAVAASGAPELIARLQRAGFEVRVAMTREARRFVSPLVLEALTHQPVAQSLWQRTVPHIQLAEWAELLLICPASATTISRIAGGDCSELVAAVAVSTRAPIVVVPSMNRAMIESPQVTRNLSLLREDGLYLVHGVPGEELAHAPGARAPMSGAMPHPSAIVDIVSFVAGRK
jgi:phosphopantothenoylcysteine decarboxylase/phosphopantothenate--cysteine ligase